MRLKLYSALALILAPFAAACFRWPAGGALMAVAAILALIRRRRSKRSPRHAV